jgi:deoxyribodipyrimidine photo-lyase
MRSSAARFASCLKPTAVLWRPRDAGGTDKDGVILQDEPGTPSHRPQPSGGRKTAARRAQRSKKLPSDSHSTAVAAAGGDVASLLLQSAQPTTGVLFTTNDMRLRDNYSLALANKLSHTTRNPLVAMLVLDDRCFAQPSAVGGFFRQSPLRAKFTLDCVVALREELEGFGVPLILRTGKPEVVVPDLCRQLGVRNLFMTTQYAPHEKAVHDAILKHPAVHADGTTARVHSVWQSTLLHIDDLPAPVSQMREGIRWFLDDLNVVTVRATAPYNCADGRLCSGATPRLPRHLEELLMPPPTDKTFVKAPPASPIRGEIPSLEDLGYSETAKFSPTTVIATQEWHAGGERAGLERMEDWLAKKDLSTYIGLAKRKRGHMKMYTHLMSRMSPYISTGCLSVRSFNERLREHCYQNAGDGAVQKQYQEALLRLGRRDYWHFVGLKYGNTLFYSYGPRPEHTDDVPEWRRDEKIVRRWCAGLTGMPFADAAMRELNSTGWVGSEGRHALVWLLTRGYGQDWRLAAEWLERSSLDYDPFVCYGSCAYSCGLIKDDFGDPVFDATYTAHKNDATGLYIRRWLPELSRVPSVYIHRPHVMTKQMQDGLGVSIGGNYPFPIKLWDGAADPTSGLISELPAYFSTPEQLKSPGALEALTFGTKVMAEEERHLVAVRLPAKRLAVTAKNAAARGLRDEDGALGQQQPLLTSGQGYE